MCFLRRWLYLSVLLFLIPAAAPASVSADEIPCAVYLGVKDYGTSEVNSKTKETFEYNFFHDDEMHVYTMDNGEPDFDSTWTYDIQNTLREGCLYSITVEEGVVKAADPVELSDENIASGIIGSVATKTISIDSKVYKFEKGVRTWRISWRAGESRIEEDLPTSGRTVRALLNGEGRITDMYLTPISTNVLYPVEYTPGEKTLKNFLAAAMQPVGTTLYMFGGGWNWQDTGPSHQVRQIGVPQSWIDFFQAQTINYNFKSADYAEGDRPENMDPVHSYYPYYGFNEYYYAGVDCSAYIAWAVYNTVNTEDDGEGYLTNSRNMAKSFADRGWGTVTKEVKKPENRKDSEYHPGDIFSIDGHVWICIGTMDDGSMVILHSTPSLSYTKQPGGGPQIGVIGDSSRCEAYGLADRYMKTYYPEWSTRYPVTIKDYAAMTAVDAENTGKFSWDVSGAGILTDPDGYLDKTAEEILADLFEEE